MFAKIGLRRRLGFLVLITTIISSAVSQSAEVYLQSVEGQWPSGQNKLCIDNPIRFYIGFNNTNDQFVRGFANGFRLYSPDGANWGGTTIDVLDGAQLPLYFDGGVFTSLINVDGVGADTVSVGGFSINSAGLYPGYFGAVIRISTGINEAGVVGKTICIDSSYYPPNGTWTWSSTLTWQPTWDGPHCFLFEPPPCEVSDPDGDAIQDCCDNCPTVYNPLQEDANANGIGDACEAGCCVIRGNVDGIGGPEVINVNDLSYLVAYLFKGGPEPPCINEANIDGIVGPGGPVDVNDLTYFTAWLFQSGPPLPPCP